MGTVDTLFNLSRAIESGRLGPGSTAVLASSGAGFTWAAMPVMGFFEAGSAKKVKGP